MLKTLFVAFLIAPSLFVTEINIDQTKIEQEPVIVKTQQQLILESINENATKFNINRNELYSVLMCESELDPTKKGDYLNGIYLANNIAQYHEETFNRHNGEFFKQYGYSLSYDSWEDNIILSSFALSKGWGNEWTAYRAIRNGGTYSFYSERLKKHYTVICHLKQFPV